MNARDEDGDTPLHDALGSPYYNTKPNLSAITVLLDAGADVYARGHFGRTPWGLAKVVKNRGVLKGSDAYEQLVSAACTKWNRQEFFESATLEEVVDCLTAGAEVNARDAFGGTPLHWAAAFNNNPAVITALVDAGSSVDARDEDGWTPLYFAAASTADPGVITALVDAGARVNARDVSGGTPLHWAAFSNDNPAVTLALLDAGADAATRDESGYTPWDYAQENEALRGTGAWWRLNEGRFE